MTAGSRASDIYRRGIARAGACRTDATVLEAVVVPTTHKELDVAVENFRSWTGDRAPRLSRGASGVDLVVVLNRGAVEEVEQRLQRVSTLVDSFRSVVVLSAELEGADDTYTTGDATGANNLFFFSFGALAEYSVSLLMETDCVPTCAGWLDAAERAVAVEMGARWVLGAAYTGGGPIGDRFWRHVNGNAFYRTGDQAFHDFYRDEFLPFYERRWDAGFRFGYDAAHELFLEESDDRGRAASLLSRWGHTPFIVNTRLHDHVSDAPNGEHGVGVLWHRGGWTKRTGKVSGPR